LRLPIVDAGKFKAGALEQLGQATLAERQLVEQLLAQQGDLGPLEAVDVLAQFRRLAAQRLSRALVDDVGGAVPQVGIQGLQGAVLLKAALEGPASVVSEK